MRNTEIANFTVLFVFIAGYLKERKKPFAVSFSVRPHKRWGYFFNAADCYFKEKNINQCSFCVLCTDEGKSGFYSGVRGLVMKAAPSITWSHHRIHRQIMASKLLPSKLQVIFSEVVKVVNFMKSKSSNPRIFKILCEEIMSLHSTLLLHTEITWLSRGKVLNRLLTRSPVFLVRSPSSTCF